MKSFRCTAAGLEGNPDGYNAVSSEVHPDGYSAASSEVHADGYKAASSEVHADGYNAASSEVHPDGYNAASREVYAEVTSGISSGRRMPTILTSRAQWNDITTARPRLGPCPQYAVLSVPVFMLVVPCRMVAE